MGIVYKNGNWWIRVNGDEHPPVHCHVVHPDGEALLYVSGNTLNRRVPEVVVAQALAWLAEHSDTVRTEWEILNKRR
jgi:hypothetical protein